MSIIGRFQTDIDQILTNFLPYCDPYVVVSWKWPDIIPWTDFEIRSHIKWNENVTINYPIDINNSQWDCSLESTGHSRHALRLGMRQVKGLKRYEAERLTASRHIAYQDINDLIRKSDISIYGLESLARADAFHSIGLTSRQALWEIKKLARQQSSGLPLFLYAEQRYKTIMPEELIVTVGPLK